MNTQKIDYKKIIEIIENNKYLSFIALILGTYFIYRLGEESGALFFKLFCK